MYLSDYAFFTFTTAIIVFLMLIGIQEHIDSYTNWGKNIHTRLQKKLTTNEPIIETTSVRYKPPSNLQAEEIKQQIIKLHSKKQNDTKIMIAIPTHNRKGYTKFNADVIRLYHKIPSEQLFIFDDCSTQYGEKELREWYGHNINYFPCTMKLLADSNIRRMFKYFSTSNYDIIFSVDSDTLFQKQWRSFILDNINKTDGMMSLYHSAANWHQTYGCDDVLCKKKSLGSAGSVMRKDVVIKMLKGNKNGKKAGGKNFDWGFVDYFKKKGIKMFVPEKSLMFHYGRKGQNNKCGTYWDFAKDFERSKMPKWIRKNMLKFEKCNAKPNDILPSPGLDTTTDCLKLSLPGYQRNIKPRYDTDTPDRENKLYQYNVYNRAITLAQKYHKTWIIDIGCGSGNKLKFIHSLGFNVVGIDFGDNIKSTRSKLPISDNVILIDFNLNNGMPIISEDIIKNSAFVSADVIEHLTNPDNFIDILKNYIEKGAVGVISTPDNDKLSKSMKPLRASDVQIWSGDGFDKYLKCHGMSFTIFERLNNKADKIKNGVGAYFGPPIPPNDYFEDITIIMKTVNRYRQNNKLIDYR